MESENEAIKPLVYDLYDKWCGGYNPLKYFSKYHSPVQNKKIYELCVYGKCAGTFDNYYFKILVRTGDQRSQDQFEGLYRKDLSEVAEMPKSRVEKLIRGYRFFDNFLDGDTLVYKQLKQAEVDEELLDLFREKYLDDEGRQIYKEIYGKYNKGY